MLARKLRCSHPGEASCACLCLLCLCVALIPPSPPLGSLALWSSAPVSILAMMSGFLVSGFVISRWKPRPVYLLSWNVLVGATYVVSELSFIFLGCPEVALQGYRQDFLGR